MKNYKMKSIVLGAVRTNCYLLWNPETGSGIIVDPADSASRIAAEVTQLGIHPEAVLLTHGHFDHMLAAREIAAKYDSIIYAYEKERALMEDPETNLSLAFAGQGYGLQADYWTYDGEHLSLAGLDIKVIATPGHTVGSCCYYIAQEGILISGDTLFCQSVGRTDFPTSSTRSLIASIRDRLFVLPEETNVYPGHEEPTTIRYEKKYNPVVPYI